MIRPLVSVVMAVRDSSRFVDSAVRSALGQTYEPLEMVVVDDGSVDGTADVLVAIRDDRLRVLHTGGRGSAAARNAGIRETTGAYVAFLDADDLWDSVKITEHIKVMEPASHVSLTFSQSRLIDENGTPLPLRVRRARGRCDFESLLRDNVIANGSAVVVRRNAIPVGGFNETLAGCVDYELWLRMALIHPGRFRLHPASSYVLPQACRARIESSDCRARHEGLARRHFRGQLTHSQNQHERQVTVPVGSRCGFGAAPTRIASASNPR